MTYEEFKDLGLKPSEVIDALNEYYGLSKERRGVITFCNKKTGQKAYSYTGYVDDARNPLDHAIKFLREMDIFYQPGMEFPKYRLSLKAQEAEFGTANISEMYPECPILRCEEDLKSIWQAEGRRERDKELKAYILEVASKNDIHIDKETFDDKSIKEIISDLLEAYHSQKITSKAQKRTIDNISIDNSNLRNTISDIRGILNERGWY